MIHEHMTPGGGDALMIYVMWLKQEVRDGDKTNSVIIWLMIKLFPWTSRLLIVWWLDLAVRWWFSFFFFCFKDVLVSPYLTNKEHDVKQCVVVYPSVYLLLVLKLLLFSFVQYYNRGFYTTFTVSWLGSFQSIYNE